MDKMKKLTFILIILILTSILLTSSGCFIQKNIEFNKAKQEIIKFDEEYWKIAEEYMLLKEKYGKSLYEIISNLEKHQGNKNLLYQDTLEQKNLAEESYKNYSGYILKFKSINIPKPLDEFYYKKIEEFNALQTGDSKYSQLLDLYIFKRDSDSINEETIKELNTLSKEEEDYKKKAGEIRLEADKIQREVYREYGLDDLINKWQK
ncbi:MAG: hypothetical protein ACYDIA_00705 [Candidatus Humimicrobiaceae bacterium]